MIRHEFPSGALVDGTIQKFVELADRIRILSSLDNRYLSASFSTEGYRPTGMQTTFAFTCLPPMNHSKSYAAASRTLARSVLPSARTTIRLAPFLEDTAAVRARGV